MRKMKIKKNCEIKYTRGQPLLHVEHRVYVNVEKVTYEAIRQCRIKIWRIIPNPQIFQKSKTDTPSGKNQRSKTIKVKFQKRTSLIKDIPAIRDTTSKPRKRKTLKVKEHTPPKTTTKVDTDDQELEEKLKLTPLIYFAYKKLQFFNYLNLQSVAKGTTDKITTNLETETN